MKKTIILTIAVSLMFLSGCSSTTNNDQSDSIAELEQQLNDLQDKFDQQQEEIDEKQEEIDELKELNESAGDDEDPAIIPDNTSTQSSFIQILSPENNAIFYEEPFYVNGETSLDCDKIVVTSKNEENNIDDVYTLQNYKRGGSTFKFGIKHEWKNLDVGKNTYTFTAKCDDGNREATINLFFEAGGGVEMAKPVIYLYPEEERQVFVLPKPEGGVTISEPELGNGWEVTAYPDGKIMDQTGTVWPYLFWEGYSNLETPEEGFLVHQNDLGVFFDKKLSYLGLIEKEIMDFKEYWLGQLDEEKYYFISFISQTELEEHAPILVEPKPDTIIRVFFDYKVSDTPFAFVEQKLEKGPERNGFIMTEWGGRLY